MDLPQIPDNDADFTPELARNIIAQYQKIITDLTEPTLKRLRFEDGSFNMELGGEPVKNLARIMTTWFRESGAKNFVEMSINALDAPFEKYLFYVQKRSDGALTPGEALSEAKAEIARHAAHVVDLEAECDQRFAKHTRLREACAPFIEYLRQIRETFPDESSTPETIIVGGPYNLTRAAFYAVAEAFEEHPA